MSEQPRIDDHVDDHDAMGVPTQSAQPNARPVLVLPTKGVPVEVWHTLHAALEDYRDDAQRIACPCSDCEGERLAAVRALRWLHAQAQEDSHE